MTPSDGATQLNNANNTYRDLGSLMSMPKRTVNPVRVSCFVFVCPAIIGVPLK